MVTKLSEVFSIETEQKHIDIPGRTTMDKLCYALTMRQKNDRDNWILITGDLGSGKSTLSIELLRKLSKYNGFKWSLKKNVLFNPDYDEINDKIHIVKPFQKPQLDDTFHSPKRRRYGNRNIHHL